MALSNIVAPRIGGLAVCALVAVASLWLAAIIGISATLIALLAGLVLQRASSIGHLRGGVQFSSDQVLKLGIILLGSRIGFQDLASLGMMPLIIAMTALVASLGSGVFLAKLMKRPVAFAVLTGSSVGICGAAAAVSISSVLPKNSSSNNQGIAEKDTICTAIIVTFLSALSMLLLPVITPLLTIPDDISGYFIGGTVHGFGQAIGAGYAVSDQSGYVATITKLTRVALLMPTVILAALSFRGSDNKSGNGLSATRLQFPLFLLGFIVLVALHSFGFIPEFTRTALVNGSQLFILIGLAALGMKTSFSALKSVGPDVFLFILFQTVVLNFVIAAFLLFIRL